MPLDPMTVVMGEVAHLEALAAVGADLRSGLEGLTIDPALRERFTRARQILGLPAELPPPQAQALLGAIRAFLAQAQDLVDRPQRPPDWSPPDDVLQSMGKGSATVAQGFRAVGAQLHGLDHRLAAPGARFLDVGTGAGWLAIALARLFPAVHVTGIDVLDRALALAQQNVAQEAMGTRVGIAKCDVCALSDVGVYDGVWLPGPFLPRAVVEAALPKVWAALKPGGVVALGLFSDSGEPLARAMTEVRSIRNGGHPWSSAEALAALATARFDQPIEIHAPMVRFFAARKPL